MSGLAVQFLDQGLHRVIFNAMPMPVFVVDPDVSILEYNSAAAQLLGGQKQDFLDRRGGDVLNCVNASATPEGCGYSDACSNCVVRQAVRRAAGGALVDRERTSLELLKNGKTTKVDVRVSSRPIQYDKHSFVLLILEGLND